MIQWPRYGLEIISQNKWWSQDTDNDNHKKIAHYKDVTDYIFVYFVNIEMT